MMTGKITLTQEEIYELTILCYKSGQMSEKQWQEHLKDKEFAEYVGRSN